MNEQTLLMFTLTGLVLIFLFNTYVCARNTTAITIMQQPGYKQPVVRPRDQIDADIRNISAQRNMGLVNLILAGVTFFPILIIVFVKY